MDCLCSGDYEVCLDGLRSKWAQFEYKIGFNAQALCAIPVTWVGCITSDEAIDQASGRNVKARIPNVDALGSDSPLPDVCESLTCVGVGARGTVASTGIEKCWEQGLYGAHQLGTGVGKGGILLSGNVCQLICWPLLNVNLLAGSLFQVDRGEGDRHVKPLGTSMGRDGASAQVHSIDGTLMGRDRVLLMGRDRVSAHSHSIDEPKGWLREQGQAQGRVLTAPWYFAAIASW